MLQEDPADASAKLLAQISLQLSSLTVANGFINSSSSSLNFPNLGATFAPTDAAVAINTLWIVSLVLSLMSAFFAILVQQWLRNIPATPSHLTAWQSIRMQHLRHQSLNRWYVPEIMALLPSLLQVAVILFLFGFHFLIPPAFTSTFIGVLSVFMILFLMSTILPFLDTTCPYKSPFVLAMLVSYQCLKILLFPIIIIIVICAIVADMTAPSTMTTTKTLKMLGLYQSLNVHEFWTNRERPILAADAADAQALCSALYKLPRSSLSKMTKRLSELSNEMRTQVALRWIALDLGNCNYEEDFTGPNRPRPEVLERLDRQIADRFKDILLAALPQSWAHDTQSSSSICILTILCEMRKWADKEFQSRVTRLLLAIRDAQSPVLAITQPSFAAIMPTKLICSYCMDDLFVFGPEGLLCLPISCT